MNLFFSELITYLIKFIIFIAIAVAGVLCGAKYKKNKMAKATIEGEASEVNSEE